MRGSPLHPWKGQFPALLMRNPKYQRGKEKEPRSFINSKTVFQNKKKIKTKNKTKQREEPRSNSELLLGKYKAQHLRSKNNSKLSKNSRERGLVVDKGWGGEWEGRKDQEFGISRCKLLYIEWINSKALLASTGNYIQHACEKPSRKRIRKRIQIYTYIYIKLNRFAVQQKLTQHCKSTIRQWNKMF